MYISIPYVNSVRSYVAPLLDLPFLPLYVQYTLIVDDDVFLKKLQRGCHKTYPTQECRPAKGIIKKVNIQLLMMRLLKYTTT
jgi:hypothetical protein